jgi:hypothetical protein
VPFSNRRFVPLFLRKTLKNVTSIFLFIISRASIGLKHYDITLVFTMIPIAGSVKLAMHSLLGVKNNNITAHFPRSTAKQQEVLGIEKFNVMVQQRPCNRMLIGIWRKVE